jgi:hypothetical protein
MAVNSTFESLHTYLPNDTPFALAPNFTHVLKLVRLVPATVDDERYMDSPCELISKQDGLLVLLLNELPS